MPSKLFVWKGTIAKFHLLQNYLDFGPRFQNSNQVSYWLIYIKRTKCFCSLKQADLHTTIKFTELITIAIVKCYRLSKKNEVIGLDTRFINLFDQKCLLKRKKQTFQLYNHDQIRCFITMLKCQSKV